MDMCQCDVAIGGDIRQVVPRRGHNPVTWPEVLMLKMIHGDHAVRNVRVIDQLESSAMAERERLALIYGERRVAQLFPGYGANLPMEAPDEFKGPMAENPTNARRGRKMKTKDNEEASDKDAAASSFPG